MSDPENENEPQEMHKKYQEQDGLLYSQAHI